MIFHEEDLENAIKYINKEIENLEQNNKIKDKGMNNMDLKRITSGFIVAISVAIMLLIPNKYVIGLLLAIIALVAMHEYLKAISKVCTPIKWVAYLSCLSVVAVNFIPEQNMLKSNNDVFTINNVNLICKCNCNRYENLI